jgi:hypothetical protein
MHSSGVRTCQVRLWLVNEGILTIKIAFARGTFGPVERRQCAGSVRAIDARSAKSQQFW